MLVSTLILLAVIGTITIKSHLESPTILANCHEIWSTGFCWSHFATILRKWVIWVNVFMEHRHNIKFTWVLLNFLCWCQYSGYNFYSFAPITLCNSHQSIPLFYLHNLVVNEKNSNNHVSGIELPYTLVTIFAVTDSTYTTKRHVASIRADYKLKV